MNWTVLLWTGKRRDLDGWIRERKYFSRVSFYIDSNDSISIFFLYQFSLSLSLFQWNVTEQKTELGKSSSRCGDSVLAKAKQNARSWRVKYSLFNRASASLSRQVDSAEHFYFHGRKIAVFTSCWNGCFPTDASPPPSLLD